MKLTRTKTLAVTAGAAAVALVAVAAPASAATTWTVKAGSAATGTSVAFTGTTQGSSPQILFTDVNTGTQLQCLTGSAPGTTKTGSGQSGTGIATIPGNTTKFNNCTGPLGLVLNVTGSGSWKLNAVSYASGVTTGNIGSVAATVTDPQGGCSFKVAGSVAGTYTNSSQLLAFPGTTAGLTISSVSGCFGLLTNGDKAEYKATYKAVAKTSAYNPITITSP